MAPGTRTVLGRFCASVPPGLAPGLTARGRAELRPAPPERRVDPQHPGRTTRLAFDEAEALLTPDLDALDHPPELGPKIRVNAVAPGLVKTDFSQAMWSDPDRLAIVENVTPLKRIGDPVEIAALANFLVSDGGSYITGQTIVVDGGLAI